MNPPSPLPRRHDHMLVVGLLLRRRGGGFLRIYIRIYIRRRCEEKRPPAVVRPRVQNNSAPNARQQLSVVVPGRTPTTSRCCTQASTHLYRIHIIARDEKKGLLSSFLRHKRIRNGAATRIPARLVGPAALRLPEGGASCVRRPCGPGACCLRLRRWRPPPGVSTAAGVSTSRYGCRSASGASATSNVAAAAAAALTAAVLEDARTRAVMHAPRLHVHQQRSAAFSRSAADLATTAMGTALVAKGRPVPPYSQVLLRGRTLPTSRCCTAAEAVCGSWTSSLPAPVSGISARLSAAERSRGRTGAGLGETPHPPPGAGLASAAMGAAAFRFKGAEGRGGTSSGSSIPCSGCASSEDRVSAWAAACGFRSSQRGAAGCAH